MRTVRVWFSKTGRAIYISHLDLMRCMTRAARRARIPVWYTQGFNARAYMTFALPLSLGISGLKESMDLRLEHEMENAEVCARLDAALPPDIHVFSVTDPVMKPGAIAYASYQLKIPSPAPEAQCEQVRALFATDPLFVEKRSKHGPLQMNLHPELRDTTVSAAEDSLQIDALLAAGGNFNLNPSLLLQCIERALFPVPEVTIVRTGLWNADKKPFQ